MTPPPTRLFCRSSLFCPFMLACNATAALTFQVALMERLAREGSITVPEAALATMGGASAFISAQIEAQRGSRAKAPGALTDAPPSEKQVAPRRSSCSRVTSHLVVRLTLCRFLLLSEGLCPSCFRWS